MYNSRNKISTKLNDTFRLKINIKAKKVCFHVNPYIRSHKRLFLYISTITTLSGTKLIPEWKLG